jgi:ankyrin repeat protein
MQMLAVLKVFVLTGTLFSLVGLPGDTWMSSPVTRDDGAPSAAVDPDDQTRELFAAIDRGDLEQVAAIINRGADVNARRSDGWTPLMAAARKGQPDVVRELLATGADPRARTVEGWTPLVAAIASGNEEVVLTLLEEDETGGAGLRPDVRRPANPIVAAVDARQRH